MTSFSRRGFLLSSAYATAGLATTVSLPAFGKPASRYLDLQDPNDALTAMIKMRGSLEAVDCPHWYEGTIYAVLPGQSPIALIDYEGSEIDYYQKQPDGSYKAYGATVSFFKDTVTGEFLETFKNPLTGREVEVKPNSITVKAHYIYSIYGMKRSDDDTPFGTTPIIQDKLKWRENGDYVWLNMRRQYPAGLPFGEDQSIQGLTADLFNPDLVSVPATASPTYIAPWLSWMDMKEVEGHSVWAGPAHKLTSVEQYPRPLLDRMEKYFPEKLTAKPA